MGMLILAGIALVVTMVVFSFDAVESKDYIGNFFYGVVVAMVVIVIGFFLAHTPEAHRYKTSETPIAALKDNSLTAGVAFLGTGHVEEEQYYFYMENTQNGQRMEKIRTDFAYVMEAETNDARLETYGYKFTSKFAIFMFGKKSPDKDYTFVVPKGTVTTDFDVDME